MSCKSGVGRGRKKKDKKDISPSLVNPKKSGQDFNIFPKQQTNNTN